MTLKDQLEKLQKEKEDEAMKTRSISFAEEAENNKAESDQKKNKKSLFFSKLLLILVEIHLLISV
jgi:hypothetical protein